MPDNKKSFESLQSKIEKLINLHRQLKEENKLLTDANSKLELSLQDEQAKLKRFEEGYSQLKAVEKSKSKKSVATLKNKVNDIISEIDKTVALLTK